MTEDPQFKGYIHDVGGPTANFRQPACRKQLTKGACIDRQCLFPRPCRNLKVDHSDYRALLKKLRQLPKVKKVFIRSGIRFDYVLAEKNGAFLRELCEHHVSGQLKVAPEHISDRVLVMYLGRVVEIADAQQLYANPMHPYTEALLAAVPEADPDVEEGKAAVPISGEVPSILNRPQGCPFHDRCPKATDRCRSEVPKLLDKGNGHQVACFLYQ